MKRLGWILVILALALPVYAQESCGDTDAEGYLLRGVERFDTGRFEEALDALNCAIELEVEDQQRAYFYRGTTYHELFNYASAEDDLLKALELDPVDTAAMNNLANVHYVRGDYAQAIELYTQSIEGRNDGREVPYYNLASLNYQMGDYDDALASLEKSVSENADYSYPYLLYGILYQTLGDERAYENYRLWLNLEETERVNRALGDTPQDFEMRKGLVYTLTFEATAGQTIFAAAQTQDDLDPLLVLMDPGARAVAGDDDSGVNLDAVISEYVAPVSGMYTLVLGQAGWDGSGTATLSLSIGGESAESFTTDTFSVYTLLVNNPVRVFTTEGDNLNLRGGPGLTFEIVDKLANNTIVNILEGPHKADGYAWWRVETSGGISGWAVERVETEQTLQPALVVGGEAVVFTNSGDKLNVRTNPGRTNELVTQLENGAVVTVLEGPVELEEYVWWKIRTADGLEGWAVDRVSWEQTLVGKPGQG